MNRSRFDVYEAKDGFRWRLLAGNGKVIADSGEAYVTRSGAIRAIKSVRRTIYSISLGEAALRGGMMNMSEAESKLFVN